MFQKIKDNFNYAKNNLNSVRFKLNYIITPAIILFCVLDLLTIFVLLCLNKGKDIIAIIILLVLFFGSVIALIVLSIITKKKEYKLEVEKLNVFFNAELLDKPVVEYILPRSNSTGVVDLVFAKDEFTIDGVKYSYSDFDCALYTSNFMYQINLILVFSKREREEESTKVKEFSLPLNLNLLTILEKFQINIVNPDVLKFIKENPETSVKQIMKYGKIQTNYYNVK